MWQSNGAIVALASQPGCICGSVAKGINNAGLIVGVGYTASFETRAVAWLPNGTIVDLGTRVGDNFSQADAVNTAGVVVGRSGYAAPFPNFGAGLKQAVSWK
jgi:probable HAF family extracellular repeat protein